jgi:hypothetical protein
MIEVPKIVQDRLRAALPERDLSDTAMVDMVHPDANLLAAFTEQALLAAERDRILQHLALCEDCREVMALALPGAEVVAAPTVGEAEPGRVIRISTKARGGGLGMLTRPSMRWAALAAGVVIAASVLLVRPGKLNQPVAPSSNHQTATIASTTAPPGSSLPVGSSSSDRLVRDNAVRDASDDARSNSGKLLSKKEPPHRLKTGRASAPPSTGENETVETSGDIALVSPLVTSGLMARNEMPAIERAKPALPENTAQYAEANGPQTDQPASRPVTAQTGAPANPSLAQNVTWAITSGALQRSLDNGQNWQNALRADHLLLCYASHGQDVWAGGQSGTIFRSVDGGITWAQVKPSFKDQVLSSDISRIEILGAVDGTEIIAISTGDHERWSSVDSGNTWQIEVIR